MDEWRSDAEWLLEQAEYLARYEEDAQRMRRIAKHGRKKLRRPNTQTYIAEAAPAKIGGNEFRSLSGGENVR